MQVSKIAVVVVFCLSMAVAVAEDALGSGSTKELVRNNTEFAFDIYARLEEAGEGNLFFSPYSISTALAMTYGGARGDTAAQMAEALRFNPEQAELHAAFAALAGRLKDVQRESEVELRIANSLWPQEDYGFLDEYLGLIDSYYDARITPVDYRRAAEAARNAINTWVEEETAGKIENLIGPDTLTPLTRLVLANAIYFKGDWESPFEEEKTRDEDFHVSGDRTVKTPMMRQRGRFQYAKTENLQILEMPYDGGDVSMLIILPREKEGLSGVEMKLSENPRLLEEWIGRLRKREVQVFFPRFTIEWGARSLVPQLRGMGMEYAFADGQADFSGMDGTRELFITDVVHKAFVEVNEEGTEAAAATGVVVGVRSIQPPPPEFRADRPFLFLIRENTTGSLLFLGRLTQPEEADEAAEKHAEEEGRELEIVNQFRGSQASVEIGPSQEVIRDERTWKRVWARAVGSRVHRPEAPEIDFDKHMALAVFMGQRSTGGYSVRIESVREFEKHIEVHYTSTSPSPGDMVTMAITSPYHIVIVPWAEQEDVRFVNERGDMSRDDIIPPPRPPVSPVPRLR